MIQFTDLFVQVFVLVLMIFPGFLLAKAGLSNPLLGKGVSNIVLYVSQTALLMSGFLYTPYNPEILGKMLAVLGLSVCAHLLFTLFGFLAFRRAPEGKRQALVFATVFTNAGYMGIPLLTAVLGAEVAIYGSIYVFVFNVFVWSLGAYLYTGEKKYISVKKMIVNPATLSALFGLVFFVLSAFGLNPFLLSFADGSVPYCVIAIARKLIDSLQATVAPLAMLIIGLRLAEVDFRHVFRDRWLYFYLAVAMLLCPALIFGVCRLLGLFGLFAGEAEALDMVTSVLLLSAAAPAATATSMFAEKYEGDARYAGVLVSISSVLCLASMPLVSLLTLLP